MNFLESVKQRARDSIKTIVLPESMEIRTLKATHTVLAEGIARVILIGNRAAILEKAGGLEISKAEFIDPATDSRIDGLADKLYEMRKAKGLTREEAGRLLREQPLYLGVMLVKEGIADGMVAGAVNATADVLRPSLQILKTAPGVKLVSAFFVIVVPNCDYGENGIFIFADSGLVQTPTPRNSPPSPSRRRSRSLFWRRRNPWSPCFPIPPKAAPATPTWTR
jgi:phosphate acetyltransferase